METDEQHHSNRGHLAKIVALVLAVIAIAALFGPTLVTHVRAQTLLPTVGHDASQQVPPLFIYADQPGFEEDYIARYYRTWMPSGVASLYSGLSPLAHPREVSRFGPYALYLLALAALGLAAWRLGGVTHLVGTLAFALGTDAFFYDLVGVIPRSFCLPLLSVAAVFLVSNRVLPLALLAVLGALFYYPAAIMCGSLLASLALMKWIPPGRPKRERVNAVVALLAAMLVVGAIGALKLESASEFGRLIDATNAADALAFPETQSPELMWDLRYGTGLWLHLKIVLHTIFFGQMIETSATWAVWQFVLVAVVCILTLAPLVVRAPNREALRRVGLLLVAIAIGWTFVVIRPDLSYQPNRQLRFLLPVAIALLLPAGVQALARASCRRLSLGGEWASACSLIAMVSLSICMKWSGASIHARTGFNLMQEQDRGIIAASHDLPPDSLIALWPEWGGTADTLAFFSERPVFLSSKTHYVFHTEYALELRRRTEALIDCLFAVDLEPFRNLRDKFGVTHFALKRPFWTQGTPLYVEPFNATIRRRARQRLRLNMEKAGIPRLTVYSDPSWLLLDLRR